MANPNPQDYGVKYKGVRDAGYKINCENIGDPSDVIRFGKKVNYDKKVTHDEVMEAHLKQMRTKMEYSKLSKDMKKQQEKEFLDHIKQLEMLEK